MYNTALYTFTDICTYICTSTGSRCTHCVHGLATDLVCVVIQPLEGTVSVLYCRGMSLKMAVLLETRSNIEERIVTLFCGWKYAVPVEFIASE